MSGQNMRVVTAVNTTPKEEGAFVDTQAMRRARSKDGHRVTKPMPRIGPRGDGSGKGIPIKAVCKHRPRRMHNERDWGPSGMPRTDGYIFGCVLCGSVVDKEAHDKMRKDNWVRRGFMPNNA